MSGMRFWFPDRPPGFHDLPLSWAVGARGGAQAPPDPAPAVLKELRDAHFAAGRCCGRCRSGRVQRWGSFSGRQRYRCRDCGRTSSDLTGTPLAYSKRPELWGDFAGCMLESLTVRATARRLGIDKDTAWRWRHALLDAHATQAGTILEGMVETYEGRFPFSRKGERLEWWERSRGRRRRYGAPNPTRVWILFGRDRCGRSAAVVSPFRRPGRLDVTELLSRRRRGIQLLFRGNVRFAAFGGLAQSMRIASARVAAQVPAGGTHLHLQNAAGYQRRFRNWLRRFRGVATKYLWNYLHWYSILDGLARPATRLLLTACRGPAPRIPRQAPGDGDASGARRNPNTSRGHT